VNPPLGQGGDAVATGAADRDECECRPIGAPSPQS